MPEIMKALPGSNQTTVGLGAMVGGIVTIAMWTMNTYFLPDGGTPAPAEIGAAATLVATAVVQRFTSA